MSLTKSLCLAPELGNILSSITDHDIEIRLASGAAEIRAVQKLRYRVFYEEMGAVACADTHLAGFDQDRFDDIADHLLVIDKSRIGLEAQVVGTYRLMRRDHAEKAGGYYSESEYDIMPLVHSGKMLLELGRSCIDSRYRKGRVMDLLWRGLGVYFRHHNIDIMFGCASFRGTDPDLFCLPLSYLYHNHTAPIDMCPVANPGQYVDMYRLDKEEINLKRAFVSLPPLIKGYIRAGCMVGDGAVVDHQFNTIDVCIVMDANRISNRYHNRFVRCSEKGRI